MVPKSTLIFYIVVVLAFGCFAEIDGNNEQKVLEVMISFDSLNEDSKNFFINQLAPIYEDFSPIVDFHFVPCSTSHIVETVLECQDGTAACQINVLHACAAHKYENEEYKLGKFFICMMTNKLQYIKGQDCAIEANMDWEWLKNCKPGQQAGVFCDNRYQQLTQLNEISIPGVIFNRKYDRKIEAAALKDLKGTICSQLAALGQQIDKCPPPPSNGQ